MIRKIHAWSANAAAAKSPSCFKIWLSVHYKKEATDKYTKNNNKSWEHNPSKTTEGLQEDLDRNLHYCDEQHCKKNQKRNTKIILQYVTINEYMQNLG